MKGPKNSTTHGAISKTKWERIAHENLGDNSDAMDRFYEIAGKLYESGMSIEESDKTAFLKVVKNER